MSPNPTRPFARITGDMPVAVGSAQQWRPISEHPADETEGDVWADFGNGLSGRVADCVFSEGRWIFQPYPFQEWEAVEAPLAWMPLPAAPDHTVLDAALRRDRAAPRDATAPDTMGGA